MLSPEGGERIKPTMNITFYTIKDDEEIEVKSWKEATHCIIDCERETRMEDILEAGRWLEAHKRSIADYALYGAYGDTPYIEVHKAAKN